MWYPLGDMNVTLCQCPRVVGKVLELESISFGFFCFLLPKRTSSCAVPALLSQSIHPRQHLAEASINIQPTPGIREKDCISFFFIFFFLLLLVSFLSFLVLFSSSFLLKLLLLLWYLFNFLYSFHYSRCCSSSLYYGCYFLFYYHCN